MIKTDLKKKREYEKYSEAYIRQIKGTYDILRHRMDAFNFVAEPNDGWSRTTIRNNTKDIHNYALSLTQDIEDFLDFIKETQHTTGE